MLLEADWTADDALIAHLTSLESLVRLGVSGFIFQTTR